MPKGMAWRATELDFIVENMEDMTVEGLEQNLPGRSRKAIKRMIEKLRDKGQVGYRYKGAKKSGTQPKDEVWGADSPWG